jgi:Tol biopolymer transport system component
VSVRRPVTEDNSVGRPSISGDGRRVAFASSRTTLVPGDTDDARDVYVRDLRTGPFTRVSLTAGGAQPDADSDAPALSPDGRYVAFASHASNLVPGDTNERSDVFVTRLGSGTLRRVSVADDGAQGDDHSAFFAELSVADRGRHVVFESSATTLVPGDTNRRPDVFVWDRHRCGRAR